METPAHERKEDEKNPAVNPATEYRFKWIEAALASPNLTDTEKVVATRLGLFANNETLACFPSVKTLAQATGLKERSLYKVKSRLRKKGWITWPDNKGGGRRGYGFVNSYELLNTHLAPPTLSRGTAETLSDEPTNPVQGEDQAPKLYYELCYNLGVLPEEEQADRQKHIELLRGWLAITEEVVGDAYSFIANSACGAQDQIGCIPTIGYFIHYVDPILRRYCAERADMDPP
jgi:hypothetical protein